MKTLLTAMAVGLLGAAASGCIIHARPGHVGVAVAIPHGHVHDHNCGHYFHKGKWYHAHGHVHRHGCGHAHVRGMWVIED